MTGALCLAIVIHLEARGEPWLGKLAVGEVVMNRVADPAFPDTICEVARQPDQFAFDPKVQPDDESVRAAQRVIGLHVVDIVFVPGALWFFNPNKARPDWASGMRAVRLIGNHLFLTRKD